MEARAALSRSGVSSLPSTQSPIKMDIAQTISVSGPLPASVPSGCNFRSTELPALYLRMTLSFICSYSIFSWPSLHSTVEARVL